MSNEFIPEQNAEDNEYDREQVEKLKLEAEANWLSQLEWPPRQMIEESLAAQV